MVKGECERHGVAREDFFFSRPTGAGSHRLELSIQLRVHLGRLVELEYVLVHRGGRGQSFVYELLYDGQGQDGRAFVLGLVDVDALHEPTQDEALAALMALEDSPTTPTVGGEEPGFGGSTGSQWGALGVGLVAEAEAPNAKTDGAVRDSTLEEPGNAEFSPSRGTSYRTSPSAKRSPEPVSEMVMAAAGSDPIIG